MIVIDGFLNPKEVENYRQQLGSASWNDGVETAGTIAAGVKQNEQVRDDSEIRLALANDLLRRLGAHSLFTSATLPQRIHPPRFNRYTNGGHYGTHIDSAVMRLEGSSDVMRSDLSATLFLSSPEEYDGGELVIEGPFGAQEVRLAAGSMVIYPSSSLHMVAPVTSGERVAAILWVQSMVREEQQRNLLFDLDQAIQTLDADIPSRLPLTGIYHNLIRQWADV